MKYFVQLTVLVLLYLINDQIRLCKSQIHLKTEGATFMQLILNDFAKFYLYDVRIENDKGFKKFFNKFGLFDTDMWKFIREGPLSNQNEGKLTFLENFQRTLFDLHKFYQVTSDCITNKTSEMVEKKFCIEEIVNESSVYNKQLSTMFKMYFLPNNDQIQSENVFDVLLDILELRKASNDFTCSSSTESIQMTIRSFLGIIIFVMMENYALVLCTYRYFHPEFLEMKNLLESIRTKNLIRTEKWFIDEQKVLWNLRSNANFIMKEALKTLKKAPIDIRRCDPPRHEQDVTYQRFTNFLQGWVGSEEYLNKKNKCGTNCAFNQPKFYRIPRTQREKLDATIGEFDERLIENGTLHNCKIAPYFNYIYKQIEPPDFERLYHHFANIKDDDVTTWGHDDQSRHQLIMRFTTKSIRHSFEKLTRRTMKRCKICLCQLERDKSKWIKAFSSTPVFVPSDRVVTGIRWVMKNNTVYLELCGSKFSNNFLDFISTSTWYTQYGKTSNKDFIVLDYHTRSLWLDDIIVPEDMFVNGAKFVLLNGIICLSVHGVSISSTGNINHNIRGWYHDIDPANHTKELMLEKPDRSEFAPTDVDALNKKLSTPGRDSIRFQPTDFRKDAAQTTVPYFDIQEVVTDPPTPLKGLGIYYKGIKGFGGFVGLKLFTADVAGEFMNHETLDRDFQTIDYLLEYSYK